MRSPPAASEAPPVCPTCLDPITHATSPRYALALWPGCRHPYHLACLARSRARIPNPVCALCRTPWPVHEDDNLSHACNTAAINPFQDSEPEPATARGSAPPPAPVAPRMSAPTWRTRPPPTGPIRTPANSWLYVPLLLAAAQELHPAAMEQWQAACGSWWDQARRALAAAPPVPPDQLIAALDITPAAGADGLCERLRTASRPLPPQAQVHCGWAVRTLQDTEGYIPAAGQEACLQVFGGLELAAALDRRSDEFRTFPHATNPDELPLLPHPPAPSTPLASAPPHPAPPTPTPARRVPAARTQARRGGRGRGRGRGAASQPDSPPPPPPLPATASPFSAFDQIDLATILRHRVLTLQAVPRRIAPSVTHGYRQALELLAAPSTLDDRVRAWKLFFLLPRMLLHRAPGTTLIPAEELDRRAAQFHAGQWQALLEDAHPTTAHSAPRPPPRRPNTQTRADRAAALAHLGELSAAARALTAEPLAPGTPATLAQLRDPARRPPEPARPLPPALLTQAPPELILSEEKFLANLRQARRGAAAGPSGATAEHLRSLLDSDADARLLFLAAQQLARAQLPDSIQAAVRLGRLVALRKPDGGVRGLVMSDVFRRLVSRTLAQQFAPAFEAACMPHQHALSTKAGAEALVRHLRAATEFDPRATILSVDGVGAYDHVSRHAMLAAIAANPDTAPLLPMLRGLYGTPSTYLWYDQHSNPHTVLQGDGGEQGDPLMPAMFSLALHTALTSISPHLQPGETLLAYLDDLYVVSPPHRTVPIFNLLQANLDAHAGISLHLGKTRVWNAAGEEPTDIHLLQPTPPAAPIWTGNWALPTNAQGLQILGTPSDTLTMWPRPCTTNTSHKLSS